MYNLIPALDVVYLASGEVIDDWGIRVSGGDKKAIKCLIKSSEESVIDVSGGKQVIPTYTISFNGKVEVNVGDCLEVEGQTFTVLKKKELKDFSRKVVFTRLTV